MSDVPALDEAVLRDVCDVLGETDRGLTNREIDSLLAEARIEDPTPRPTSPFVYVAVSKRDRLFAALSRRQRADGRANAPLHFAKLAMRPVRFRSDPDRFDDLRSELNTALAFAGLALTEGGRLRPLERSASTLSEARRRARRLRSQLADRGAHARLLAACVDEIRDDNYFHAVLEGAKSLAAELRSKTGRTEDGIELVNAVLERGQRRYPLLALNTLATQTERSRQRGLAEHLRGVFSDMRNPTAHEPKVTSHMTEQDALDALTFMSYLHRRLAVCASTAAATHAATG